MALVDTFVSYYAISNLSGQIPSVEDANRREGVLTFPWQEQPLELGSRVAQAFSNPKEFLNTQEQFQVNFSSASYLV